MEWNYSLSQKLNYLKLQFGASSLEFVWMVIFIFIPVLMREVWG